MNININNYEEYFLLYTDNELSAREKNIVEEFVCQHPELEEELLMFKQSVIKPDDACVLVDKGFLFKETRKFISYDNYQQIFIMYSDNELNGLERQQTETFLLQNPKLHNEFMLLQKTKLTPDNTITFPGKQSLYKKEGKGKVVSIKWWRNVAAAIITAIALWSGITYLQKDKEKMPVTVGSNPAKKINKISPVPVNKKSNESVKSIVVENTRGKNGSSQKVIVKNSTGKSSVKHTPNVQLVQKQKQPIIAPQPNMSIKNIENENQSIAINKVLELNDIKLIKKNTDSDNALTNETKLKDIAVNDKNELPDNYALPAFYTSEQDENSNNYVFYNITEEEFRKTRLSGFLRKVKRTIERKSPFNNSKDDNEITVKNHSKKL